jgi:hypothetical protein
VEVLAKDGPEIVAVTAADARQLRAALVSGCSLAGAEACAIAHAASLR